MGQYYYFATSLPVIRIGEPVELSFQDFITLAKQNLSASDEQMLQRVRTYYDIRNIRALWKEEDFERYGNLDRLSLEEALISRIGLPEYVYNFLELYDSSQRCLDHFPQLISWYFHEESQKNGFLEQYLNFERELRLILATFRAKKLGRDVVAELQYEPPSDEIVAQIIAQKDAKSYEPPYRYSDLKPIFDKYSDQPLDLHLALNEYRFHKISDMIGVDMFSEERILSYMVRLIIAEKWQELDQQKGIQIIDQIVKEAS
ncbi:MAG: hypothetical protein Tsb0021_17750 [Chlamydiales bacterium]